MNNLSPQGFYAGGGGGDQGSLLSEYWIWKRAGGS